MAISFNKRSRLVFFGDLATDSGRDRDDEKIGDGYVRMIRDYLRARDTATAPVVINHGHSGQRLSSLAEQVQQDVPAERPDVVSFMVDVPDAHRAGADSRDSLDDFRTLYREALSRTMTAAPRCKLVLCEPPAVWSTAPFEADEVLRPYVHSLMQIGREYNAQAIVPVHSALVYARKTRPDVTWLNADQQLSSSAHMTIALTWLESLEIFASTHG